ncbi:MAG: hypothetical protein KAR42_07570 [candidate division Zixibacteria bacterium]|nr:hypothetical protein [candidate division Zixibacteria bacterium]
MRQTVKTVMVGLTILICLFTTDVWSTMDDNIPQHFNVNVESITPLVTDAPVTFRLSYELKEGYERQVGEIGDVKICLFQSGTADTLASYDWIVQHDKFYSHSVEFDLIIPDNNLFILRIDIESGKTGYYGGYYIASTGNMIQVTTNRKEIVNLPQKKPAPIKETTDIPFDKLTNEQKQLRFKFGVDLSKPEYREFVEKLVGPVPETSLGKAKRQAYEIETTLENAKKIAEQGIEIDFVEKRPRWRYNSEKEEYDLIRDTSQ